MELAELLAEFESLGDNCEFGFVHRNVDAKGRGLFQWAGMPLANLIPSLYTRFKGLDDPANFKVMYHKVLSHDDEYVIYINGFNFRVHTGSYRSKSSEENVVRETATRMRYLIRKLIQDLEEGSKIFVFRQNEAVDAATMRELRNAIACYGSNTLLWVAEDPNVPDGTITWLGDGLMKGSVTHLSNRLTVASAWHHGWHRVLWNAYAERSFGGDDTYLTRMPMMFNVGQTVAHVSFVAEAPQVATLLNGWGAAEKNQTWCGAECRLRLQSALPDSNLLVRLEGLPFEDGSGRGSRMIVWANGVQVVKYRAIPKFFVQFVLPRVCLKPGAPLELKFQFPDADTPASVGHGTSVRLLGYAFRSLTISTIKYL